VKTPSIDVAALTARLAALEPIVADLEERKRIHDVYVHYGRGIDRLDEQSFRLAFWPDARIGYGTSEVISPDEHWKNHMLGSHHKDYQAWGHLLTNETTDINGDVAHVEIYVTPMWVPKDKAQAKNWLLISGRYVDRLERRNGEWRIAAREFVPHFAMKVDVSNYEQMVSGWLSNGNSECFKDPWVIPWGRGDVSYVRPLNGRTDKSPGPPCANPITVETP
jgi:hypothetical protein